VGGLPATTRWRPSGALARSLLLGGLGLGGSVLSGEPVLLVLAAPFAVVAVLMLRHRPQREPSVTSYAGQGLLHEGQGTTLRLEVRDGAEVEHVLRALAPAEHVASRPSPARVSALVSADGQVDGQVDVPDVVVVPERWGRRRLGEEQVALSTRWAGFRWGPTTLTGRAVDVLPGTLPTSGHAELPDPAGLVGRHRSRRTGTGAELAEIREFRLGDRLRRISWRVTSRTGTVHVTTAPAEEDAGVLLLLDALADHGRSGGLGGSQSTLDVAVRAAASLASDHLRAGDRVGLRVLGPSPVVLRPGGGRGHLHRLLTTLARVEPGGGGERGVEVPTRLPVMAGTVVVVLTPALDERVTTMAATALRHGLPTVVVDTLTDQVRPGVGEGADPRVVEAAWRLRLLEREPVLDALAALGCPVVAWRGPGTLDAVLAGLRRRGPVHAGSGA